MVLTGTPIQNDLQELFALSDFCNPGVLGMYVLLTYIYDINDILAATFYTSVILFMFNLQLHVISAYYHLPFDVSF